MKLTKAINKLENEKEIERFLKDLCTPSELNAFEERWEVAKLLYKKDMSYRDIAKTLKTKGLKVLSVSGETFVNSSLKNIESLAKIFRAV